MKVFEEIDSDCQEPGEFVVGTRYVYRRWNDRRSREESYVVTKRTAKFVTIVNTDPRLAAVPGGTRRLTIRRGACGSECVILGHPKACVLDLLWAADSVLVTRVGLWMETKVIGPDSPTTVPATPAEVTA